MKRRLQLLGPLMLLCLLLQSQVSKKSSNQELKTIQSTAEAKAVMDVVHADDVIIQGSVCVGFDCVNNENFGADTERLKENNLRIHFDDTSTSSGFPFNDWRIVINDQASGGASYFAVEDVTGGKTPFKIEANSPSNLLYLDNSGKIGIKTSTPAVDVHDVSGNTPTIRLDQNSSSGFTPQVWDIAGNEANFFIRDVTSGSRLPFRIRPGAPTSSIDINASGYIGLGSASPNGPLHIKKGNLDSLLLVDDIGKLYIRDTLILKNKGIKFPDGTTQITALAGAGGTGTFTDLNVMGNIYLKGVMFPGASFPSDFNLKRDINPLVDATTVIKELFPKTFYYKNEYAAEMGFPKTKQYGLIAQEVESVLPDFIKNFVTKAGETFKSVDYTSFIPILIQAFKEQQGTIELQAKQIDQLKSRLDKYSALEDRIAALENGRKTNTLEKNTK